MSATLDRGRADLHRRARRAGLQTSYLDADGLARSASDDALDALLELLDAARFERDRGNEASCLDPVVVVRPGARSRLALGSVAPLRDAVLRDEWGEDRQIDLAALVRPARAGYELELAQLELATGYYELFFNLGARDESCFVMVAPRKLALDTVGRGLFQPIYGLREGADLGVGSYGAFGRLARLVAGEGVDFLATLPCYAAYLEEPFEPSPYLPVSRLAWNELFIDVAAVPELAITPDAQQLRASIKGDLGASRVDYARSATAKRSLLEQLGTTLFCAGGARRQALAAFVSRHPEIVEYAEFRAAQERSAPHHRELDSASYHTYVQFLAGEQLGALRAGVDGLGLCLDFPVGVHPDGFDVTRWPECFLSKASAGAPPDSFHASGQRWGFPPLNPRGLRASRYAYLIATYRRAFELANLLRIDHVMGLERIWVVPEGSPADDGVYLTYPHQEMRAIVLIEAARAGASVVGEDLGTVPAATTRHMEQDGMLHSAVYRFEASASTPIPKIKRRAIVSFGTHDLARFAAFVSGIDLTEEPAPRAHGADGLEAARAERSQWVRTLRAALGVEEETPPELLYRALFSRLNEDEPAGLLLDLGDCLGDPERENLPGHDDQHRNWTHRSPSTLDQLASDGRLLDMLRSLARPPGACASVGES